MTTDRPPIRWGLLGTGGITSKLIAGAATTPTAEIVAVGSRTPGARRRVTPPARGSPGSTARTRRSSPTPRWTRSTSRCRTRSTTPGRWPRSRRASTSCARSPTPATPRRSRSAWDAAEAAGRGPPGSLHVAPSPAGGPHARPAPGAGRRCRSSARRSRSSSTTPYDVRIDAELEGGSLMDVGCYTISGSRLLAGEEPDEVVGYQVVGPTGVDLTFTGLLHFPSGVVAEIASGLHDGPPRARGDRHGRIRSAAADPWQSIPATVWHGDDETTYELDRPVLAASSTTWPPRSAARRPRGWVGPMRSGRPGRSRRSTAPRPPDAGPPLAPARRRGP